MRQRGDRRICKGRITYADGSAWEGQWDNDMRNGKGIAVMTDGTKVNGEWKDDVLLKVY